MTELLITSSVLILVIVLLRAVLKNRVSARLIYALWLVAVIRLVLPFELVPSPVSVMNAAPDAIRAVSEAVRVDERVPALPQPGAEAVPAPGPGTSGVTVGTGGGYGNLPGGTAHVDAPGTQDTAVQPPNYTADVESPFDGLDTAQILTMLWMLGAALFAVYFITVNGAMYFRLRGARRSVEIPGVKLRVYLVEGIPSPCLSGVFRPAIYLTPAALENEERTWMVILHEETHYRHGDHLWALLRCALLCVYWFDPFVWLAASLSRRDAELACDESCVKALGYEKRIDYGQALIDLIDRSRRGGSLMHTATTMSAGKRAMKARLRRIVKAPKSRAAAVVLVIALVGAVTACTFTGAEVGETPSAAPAEMLANRTAYTRLPDGSVYQEAAEAHHYTWSDGVLELYSGEERAFTLEADTEIEPAVFLSDTLDAVAYTDDLGLHVLVGSDGSGNWAHERTPNFEMDDGEVLGSTYIGFSYELEGWLAQELNYFTNGDVRRVVLWVTDDGGETWTLMDDNLPVYDFERVAGFAVTRDNCLVYTSDLGDNGMSVSILDRPEGSPVGIYDFDGIQPSMEVDKVEDIILAPRLNDTEIGFEYSILNEEEGVIGTLRPGGYEDVFPDGKPTGFWRVPSELDPGNAGAAELIPGELYLLPVSGIDDPALDCFRTYKVPYYLNGESCDAWAAIYSVWGGVDIDVSAGSDLIGWGRAEPDAPLLIPVQSLDAEGQLPVISFTGADGEVVNYALSSDSVGQVNFEETFMAYNTLPADAGISLALHPDGISTEGGDWRYYVPENQDEFMDAFNEAVESARAMTYDEMVNRSVRDSGVWLYYDGEYYELLEDGSMLFNRDITNADGQSVNERCISEPEYCSELYDLAVKAARQAGIGQPVTPEELRGITSATLTTVDSVTLTDVNVLTELQNILTNSWNLYGVPACFFTTRLDLEFIEHEPVTIYIAADSCGAWVSNGVYYNFRSGTTGNAGLYALFGRSAGTHSRAEDFDTGFGVRANYLNARVMNAYDAGHRTYISGFPPKTEFLSQVALMADETVTNVRIFELEYTDETHMTAIEGAAVGWISELTPDKVIIFDNLDVGDFTQTRGIAFTDASGVEHRYRVVPNYEGGGVSLVEIPGDTTPDISLAIVDGVTPHSMPDSNAGSVWPFALDRELCRVISKLDGWYLVNFTPSEAQISIGWVPASSCTEYTDALRSQTRGPFAPRQGTQTYNEDGVPAEGWTLDEFQTFTLDEPGAQPNEHGLVHVAGTYGGWYTWIKVEDVVYP